ncbi:NAD(P)/FAD-dependent oxidoreductase [bacterium]|nr:NAD(P)/FAD-dependent oxidoreductase [bacterium]
MKPSTSAGNPYDAIVVGGGIAGLTAAAYLARAGRRVLLFEKNEECGGLVNSFTRDGFHFDAGVRALEDAGIIFPMLEDLGIHLEVVKSPVSLGIEHEMLHVQGLESLEDYRMLLARLYPESEQEIDAVLAVIRKIMKHMDVLYGIENPIFKDIPGDRDFLFKKLLPWLPRFLFTVGRINRMNMPVEDYLDTLVSTPALKDIISQHFFKNTPTFFALSYFSLYLDYFYPKGGVGRLAEAVQRKVEAFGGEIKTGTRIVAVAADTRLVTDERGQEYGYGDLVWAADLKTLYDITGTGGLPAKTAAAIANEKSRMLACRGGDSVFSIFLEVDEPLESFRKIANGHFFYTPSKQGLGGVHRQGLNDLLASWETVTREEVLAWLDTFTRLNTYEISIPGLKDPDLAPPGKTGLIISLLAEYDLFKKVEESGWYAEFKTAFEESMLRVIAGSVYPMLKDRVIARFSFSPVSIAERIASSEGAITGWSFEYPVPVVHKIQYSDRSVLTPIPSIYQAGQWAYSPAGVPMSILTGRLAADKILKKRTV